MADGLRVVEFSAGGRPVEIMDLEDGDSYFKARPGVKVTAPGKTPQTSGLGGRFGGSQTVGEQQDNGELAATFGVRGATAVEAMGNVQALVQAVDSAAKGRFLEWTPEGADPGFLRVMGPGSWAPSYDQRLFAQRQAYVFDVAWPVHPLVHRAPTDVWNDFAVPADAVLLQTNYVTNPSIEVDTTDWSGSATGGIGLTSTLARDTGQSHDGLASLAVTTPGGASTQGASVALGRLRAGQTVTAAAWVRVPTAQSMRISLQDNIFVNGVQTSTVALSANTWTRLTVTWTPTADSPNARLYIYTLSGAAAQTFWIDGAIVSDGAATPTYFDGSSDKAAWTGTAHASVSQLYDRSTQDEFQFDNGVAADVAIASGRMVPAGVLTTERGMVHTARGYSFLEGQGTISGAPGATLNGFKLGRRLRRVNANTFIEVYVDDNGTNSRLRIDVVINGTRTNRASVNLATRISNGTQLWVRGRVEGQKVFAEHFTSEPSPMATPANVSPSGGAGYTLTATEQQSLPAGELGMVWIPQDSAAWVDDYYDKPFIWKNQTLPVKVSPLDPIPGAAPALVDWEIGTSGGAAAPVWAMLALLERPDVAVSGIAPFAIFEAETAGDLAGWAAGADADASGGNSIRDTTPTSAETYTASWVVDPSTLEPDGFSDDVVLEVWARVRLGSSLVSPKLTLSARPSSGLGAERFTAEYGSAGKLLTVPSSGAARRFVRLGTLTLPADPAQRATWKLWLAGTLGAGSGGADWGIDRLAVLPVRARVSGPTAKANDTSYPKFVTVTTEVRKRVLSDRRGLAAAPTGAFVPDAGLPSGSQRIEPQPGPFDLLAKLSSLVPDDPTVDASTEQLSHTASLHLIVHPRDYLVGT